MLKQFKPKETYCINTATQPLAASKFVSKSLKVALSRLFFYY